MTPPRIIVVQPALPSYRVSFFARLYGIYGQRLLVHASKGSLGVLTEVGAARPWERPLGDVRPLGLGFQWQTGALGVVINRNDVLVVSGAPRCLSNLALLVKGWFKGAKVIWWGHYWSSTSRPLRAMLRILLMRLSDGILFYTDREVEEYLSARGGSRKPISALNNGIETEDIVRLRAPYVPSSRRGDLLFIGRVVPKANLELLIETLAVPTCAGVRLDVIGDGAGRVLLQRRCAELGIADRIVWRGGIVDEPRIAEIANTCKAFVYPGSVGLSLIHGFAYGLPAIVHDNRWGHMPEIAALRAGQNGVTFREGDAESLAEAIAGLLTNPKRLQAMSVAAIATTVHSFNAADMTDRFCAAIAAVRTDSGTQAWFSFGDTE